MVAVLMAYAPKLFLIYATLMTIDILGALSSLPSTFYAPSQDEREFFIANLLVRIHFIIVVIRWTGLAPWAFEFPFPGMTLISCADLEPMFKP